MKTVPLKLVTIIAESVIEARITTDLRKKGARGFTVTQASGKGSRGIRVSDMEAGNVKIESIVSPEVAEAILEHLQKTYFPYYAVIAYLENVEVVRGDKYV